MGAALSNPKQKEKRTLLGDSRFVCRIGHHTHKGSDWESTHPGAAAVGSSERGCMTVIVCSVNLSVMVARCWRFFGHSGRIYSWCATASLATGASNRFWRHLETLASRRSVAHEAGLV